MRYDRIFLERKAKELGFVRDTLEKVYRLVEILEYINRHALLSKALILKGGTAINLCILDLPRLSVDIDLDFSMNVTKDEMFSIREEIKQIFHAYMMENGYALHPRSKYTHSLDSLVYSYTNTGGNLDIIKIEINYSLRSHIFEPVKMKLSKKIFDSEIEVLTLNPIELYAAKINALLNRAAVRDLYDLCNIIDMIDFSLEELEMLRKSVIFYSIISADIKNVDFTTENLDKITIHRVMRELFPVIACKEHFDLDEKEMKVNNFISNLMILTKKEKQFIDCFIEKEYRLDLLFDNSEIIKRLEMHPMIIWRLSK